MTSLSVRLFVAVLAMLFVASVSARAQSSWGEPAAAAAKGFKTLYRFQGGKDGDSPNGGVVVHDGAIYGTTYYDGVCSNYPYCGILYKLTKVGSGWKRATLHDFGKTLSDGIEPIAPLNIRNSTLFGTTSAGANAQCGCGEVFQLTLPAGYRIIQHLTFHLGANPLGGLLIAADGTKYGTTSGRGTKGGGVIYKVSAGGSYSVVYNLKGTPGAGPAGELISGKDGAIYGTSYGGGKYDQGYVFRIETNGSGFKDLYDFKNNFEVDGLDDGAQPEGRLALGSGGTIYGTTELGGTDYGTAWSLSPESGGGWKYKQLYIFGSAGNTPHSGLVLYKGALYGVGAGGGEYQSGVIFSFTESSPGNWKYHLLHSFKARDAGGDDPQADLRVANGVIYGTTLTGGHVTDGGDCINGCGTVFQYVP
jgi:uncharacterized repeat protein (TIGR03803 family)